MRLVSCVDQKHMEPRLLVWSKIPMSIFELVILVITIIAAVSGVKITIGDINIGNTRKDDTNKK
jgi:hypothetical protein